MLMKREGASPALICSPAVCLRSIKPTKVTIWHLALLLFACFPVSSTCQTSEWGWVGGSSVRGSLGVYGMLGSAAGANLPGSRQAGASWQDEGGNFWLFGGYGYGSSGAPGDYYTLNDVWKYSPSTNEWTWMGGNNQPGNNGITGVYGTLDVAAADNIPSTRSNVAVTTDQSGNVWIFGGSGDGQDATLINDLWKFNPSTNLWTWMSGSSTAEWNGGQYGVYGSLGMPGAVNVPGSRESAALWTDSNGNLWLFGGYGLASTPTVPSQENARALNDLWEFNTSTNQWAWMGGISTVGSSPPQGVYGTLGSPASTNFPGARTGFANWADHEGKFWIFSGVGYDGTDHTGWLNDLWRFDPATTEWTWMGGSSSLDCILVPYLNGTECIEYGVYGTTGQSAPDNIPGARQYASTFTDSEGNLLLFGGNGYDSTVGPYGLSDLWKYSVASGEWTSIYAPPPIQCGTESNGYCVFFYQPTPTYPPLENFDPANAVPGRYGAGGWLDASNNPWVFGGSSLYDDLWEYRALVHAPSPAFSVEAGNYVTSQSVALSDTAAGAIIYYTTDGKTTPTANSTKYTSPITISGNETIEAIAIVNGYLDSAVASASYVFPANFSLSATPTMLTVDSGAQATLTLLVSPQNGFNSAVSFSCSGLPSGASCAFSPDSVTPAAAGSSVQVTITAGTQASAVLPGRRPALPAVAVALCACLWGFRRRRGLKICLLLAIAGAGVALLSSCGGGGSGGGSTTGNSPMPVTSTLTVTATAGTLVQTSTITLTLN